jgi:hypothetical protein
MIKLKTVVPKQGKIEDYINKPFLDKILEDSFESNAIGIINDAIEVEDGFELTITIWKQEIITEWFSDGQLSAMSFRMDQKSKPKSDDEFHKNVE